MFEIKRSFFAPDEGAGGTAPLSPFGTALPSPKGGGEPSPVPAGDGKTEGKDAAASVPPGERAGDDTSSGIRLAGEGDGGRRLASRSFCRKNLPPAAFSEAKVLKGKAQPEAAPEADPEVVTDPAPAPAPAPDGALMAHYRSLRRQAGELRSLLPDFRLEDALTDPRFVRFTSPEGGLSVRQAVWALCGDRLQAQAVEAVARRAREDAARALRSGSRPRENACSTASVAARPDLRGMSREERHSYILGKYGQGE